MVFASFLRVVGGNLTLVEGGLSFDESLFEDGEDLVLGHSVEVDVIVDVVMVVAEGEGEFE